MSFGQSEQSASQDVPHTQLPMASAPFAIMTAVPNTKPQTPQASPTSAPPSEAKPFAATSSVTTNMQPSSIDGAQDSSPEPEIIATSTPAHLHEVDPQIIEALRGKDRIFVLKLGELMEGLIRDRRRPPIEVTPNTTYQRLLVHRCSAYYKLNPETDPFSKAIFVSSTPESQIPLMKISELVPPENSIQPAFKIMRRSSTDRRNKSSHPAGSTAGEDGDLSDLDPSETGSLGGRSNTTGGSAKKHMTIEEREAAYNEARSRIFMDFEEKEKAKGKDINSSSSSLSATSGSGSLRNGGSSTGDADSSSSSLATESEWSGPPCRDRRPQSGNVSASSSRSIRSPAYVNNGSGSSSRNSRATSPSPFPYGQYEPANSLPLYDPSQPPPAHMGPMYHPPYGYPYNPGQPNPGYPPYPPYYPPPYPQYQSPPPQQPMPDPSTPPNSGERYPPQMRYGNPCMWPQPGQHPLQSPPPMHHPPIPNQPHPSNNPSLTMGHPTGQPPYPYMPPQGYPYPMPTYYPPGPQHHMPPPPPPPPSHMTPQLYDPRSPGNGPNNGQVNGLQNAPPGIMQPTLSGPPHQRNSGTVNGNNYKPRNGPVQPNRMPWSYGPGVGAGGYVATGSNTNDTVGPRLSSNRRQNSMGSSFANGRSTSNDDTVSVASSASSSSRRTQPTTPSSQHPLPKRPDWVMNVKPQRNMSPMSPPSRNVNGNNPQSNYLPRQPAHPNQPTSLQSTDFPPLTSMPPSERRVPGPTGAWGNGTTRSIIFGQVNNGSSGHTPASGAVNPLDDEAGFERPPPKSAELYNPKLPKRGLTNPSNNTSIDGQNAQPGNEKEIEKGGGGAINATALVNQVAALSLNNNASSSVAEGSMTSPPTSIAMLASQ